METNTKLLHILIFLITALVLSVKPSSVDPNYGEEYMIAFGRNSRGVTGVTLSISGKQASKIRMTNYFTGEVDHLSLPRLGLLEINLPVSIVLDDVELQNKSILIESNCSLVINGFVQLGNLTPTSFTAMHRSDGDNKYIAVQYMPARRPSLAKTFLYVVAYEDGTNGTIDVYMYRVRRPYLDQSFSGLNRGSVYMYLIESDITGSIIKATGPIAVFSGSQCSEVPYYVMEDCHMLLTSLPPTNVLGGKFLLKALEPTNFFDTIRVVAAWDNTEVWIEGKMVDYLHEGSYTEFEILADVAAYVETSNPCLVVQYKECDDMDHGDPLYFIVPPYQAYQKVYTLLVPTNLHMIDEHCVLVLAQQYSHLLNITANGLPMSHTGEIINPYSLGVVAFFTLDTSVAIPGTVVRVESKHNVGLIQSGHKANTTLIYGITGSASFDNHTFCDHDETTTTPFYSPSDVVSTTAFITTETQSSADSSDTAIASSPSGMPPSTDTATAFVPTGMPSSTDATDTAAASTPSGMPPSTGATDTATASTSSGMPPSTDTATVSTPIGMSSSTDSSDTATPPTPTGMPSTDSSDAAPPPTPTGMSSTDSSDTATPPTPTGIPSTDSSDTASPPTPTGMPSTDSSDTATPPMPTGMPSTDTSDTATPPTPTGMSSTDSSDTATPPTPTGMPSTDSSDTASPHTPTGMSSTDSSDTATPSIPTGMPSSTDSATASTPSGMPPSTDTATVSTPIGMSPSTDSSDTATPPTPTGMPSSDSSDTATPSTPTGMSSTDSSDTATPPTPTGMPSTDSSDTATPPTPTGMSSTDSSDTATPSIPTGMPSSTDSSDTATPPTPTGMPSTDSSDTATPPTPTGMSSTDSSDTATPSIPTGMPSSTDSSDTATPSVPTGMPSSTDFTDTATSIPTGMQSSTDLATASTPTGMPSTDFSDTALASSPSGIPPSSDATDSSAGDVTNVTQSYSMSDGATTTAAITDTPPSTGSSDGSVTSISDTASVTTPAVTMPTLTPESLEDPSEFGPIFVVEVECAETSNRTQSSLPSKIWITNDFPHPKFTAHCKDGFVGHFASENQVNWYLDVFFDGDSSQRCIFYKLNGSEIYTLKITRAKGDKFGQVIKDLEKFAVTCTYDDYSLHVSTNKTKIVESWNHPPKHIGQNMGEPAISDVVLTVQDARGDPISGPIPISRKVRLHGEINGTSTEKGIRALTCLAVSGPHTVPIIISMCGNGVLFGKNEGFYTRGLQVNSPYFKPIRVNLDRNVKFVCNFTICAQNCDGKNCVPPAPLITTTVPSGTT